MKANETKNVGNVQETGEESFFSLKNIYRILILNWMWFLLSLIICVGCAYAYLRYSTPVYQATAKLLIKDDESSSQGRNTRSALQNVANLGIMTNSTGIDNEMEILQSKTIAQEAVKNIKLYADYTIKGRLKEQILYKTQAINVDLDSIESLESSISMEITRKGNSYKITGEYLAPAPEGKEDQKPSEETIDATIQTLPAVVKTKVGTLYFTINGSRQMKDGTTMNVTINPLINVATAYAKSLNVAQSSKTTTIAILSITNTHPQRALDYLNALVDAYNFQANEDKNEIARRTEEFINDRLDKISQELGLTEGSIEDFKKNNQVIELDLNAAQTVQNANEYDQKLTEINMQINLINSLSSYLADENNRYNVMPSNVGLTDASTTALITQFNTIALQRNHLLQTGASEENDVVKPLASQLDELRASIKSAMKQAKNQLEIQRNSISQQYNKYQGQILSSPEQQRVMAEIGRQQEVQTALYTMLLQKREENSISLAATADKGKLIDLPSYNGQVSPKKSMIMMLALILGLGLPFVFFFLNNFFRYKIEGHDEVARLTRLPILADVAIASDRAKGKADIVVHENENNMMSEVFRSMRTNLQFTLTEGQKVIMATSSIAGEGKTFCISNLAISFALLGKKVIIVGLDIRKPRLAELFQINDHKHGITPLLSLLNPTKEDVNAQVVNSGVNNNLDLLMAGPIPPNPAELVERQQLDTVFNILKEQYDYVFVDTAPVGLVTDTFTIGRIADATIVICRADYTPKDNLLMMNDLSEEKKLPNMSLVINGINMAKKKYGYYYGYGRYGRYGHYGKSYKSYGKYGSYGHYGSYGNYGNSSYGKKGDDSIKVK